MTDFTYNAGDVFQPKGHHCYVIISDTERDPNQLVLVNFTGLEFYKDQSCIIHVGEHLFITKETCMNYAKARIADRSMLEQAEAAGLTPRWDPVSPELLARIRSGAEQTNELPQDVEVFLRAQGIVNGE